MNTKVIFVLLGILFCVSPAFAANLNVTFTNLAPTYVNTYQNVSMLNITMISDGNVNVTGVVVNLIGNASAGNISNVMLYNSTAPVASNSTWTSDYTLLSISNGMIVTAQTNLVIVYTISGNALSLLTAGANITANTSIITNETVFASQYNSSLAQIQSLHASASVTPKYVDTNVINQSFTYTITPTGQDLFNKTKIVVPSEYAVVATNTSFGTCNPNQFVNASGNNITIDIPWNQFSSCGISASTPLIVTIKANTSSSVVSSKAFTSIISGENLTDIATITTGDATNVTTLELLKILSVEATKTTALLNGSDYWEFRFTMNVSAPIDINGLVQFKMNNWNNTAGNIIDITATSTTLRNESSFSTSNKVNVTNSYPADTAGVLLTKKGASYLYLRMIVPPTAQISSSWWTTYWAVFRASA